MVEELQFWLIVQHKRTFSGDLLTEIYKMGHFSRDIPRKNLPRANLSHLSGSARQCVTWSNVERFAPTSKVLREVFR